MYWLISSAFHDGTSVVFVVNFLRRHYFTSEGQKVHVTVVAKTGLRYLRTLPTLLDANVTFTMLMGKSENAEMMKPSSVTPSLCNM